MKFTPTEDIKSKGRIYEADAALDSEKQGIPDETIERWYQSGWIEIEGRDPSPERKPGAQRIQPAGAKE